MLSDRIGLDGPWNEGPGWGEDESTGRQHTPCWERGQGRPSRGEDPGPLSPEGDGPEHGEWGVGGRLVEGGCFGGPRSLISLWTSSQRLAKACHGSDTDHAAPGQRVP